MESSESDSNRSSRSSRQKTSKDEVVGGIPTEEEFQKFVRPSMDIHKDMGSLRVHFKKTEPRPKFVKHYILGQKLGEGAYSKVKEGIDSQTLRIVAVKIIDKRFLKKVRGGMENVKREISILKQLKGHKNIIELIEVIDEPNAPKLYIVMELANGCSLQQLTESAPNNRLPHHQARYYFRQLVEGLEFMHSRNVVHRDIKPSNLMLTTKGEIKISDFGVAEFLDRYAELDLVTRSTGSPAFQAPEIAKGESDFSGRKVDIWAAGVTLFYCLTGRLPFDGNNLFELFEKIGKGEFEIPSFVEESAKDLLLHVLDPVQQRRYSLEEVKRHPFVSEMDDVDSYSTFVPIPARKPQVLNLVARLFYAVAGEGFLNKEEEEEDDDDDDEEPTENRETANWRCSII
ncbi:Serine/threonine-protein kinase STK11 [Galdieria sulphuraria]|nr:Serine/threonine-protein kinase STK11 [Galdieria sulphuraria]